MTDDEFRLFRDFIHRECGLYFGEDKRSFFGARVSKRMASKNITSFYRYYRQLQECDTDRKAELLHLMDLLTINETSFFRNLPQFRLLEQVVLPEILREKNSNSSPSSPRLRIWSAGCSTGEEPYSIAISVLETLPNIDRTRVQIFASDLALSVLETATRGIYAPRQLEALDPVRLHRYFRSCSEGYAVRDEVRRMVICDFHNLKHENGLRDLDVIFCRNVLIYFDAEEQKKVLKKFLAALRSGGYLFLGHSESLIGQADELEFVHHDKGTAYRKVSAE